MCCLPKRSKINSCWCLFHRNRISIYRRVQKSSWWVYQIRVMKISKRKQRIRHNLSLFFFHVEKHFKYNIFSAQVIFFVCLSLTSWYIGIHLGSDKRHKNGAKEPTRKWKTRLVSVMTPNSVTFVIGTSHVYVI